MSRATQTVDADTGEILDESDGKGFDPRPYIIDIKGKAYLEVKWRLVWLRDRHPLWGVVTQLESAGEHFVVMRAEVQDETGRAIATGYAEAPVNGKFPALMKAETAAIGRALGHAGFGTQFSGDDEGEDVVDSPVERPIQRQSPPPVMLGKPEIDEAVAVIDAVVDDESAAAAKAWLMGQPAELATVPEVKAAMGRAATRVAKEPVAA